MRLAGCLLAALLVLLAGHVAHGRPVMKTIGAVKPGYYLATYAEGPFEVTLAISELGPHFRQELLLRR